MILAPYVYQNSQAAAPKPSLSTGLNTGLLTAL